MVVDNDKLGKLHKTVIQSIGLYASKACEHLRTYIPDPSNLDGLQVVVDHKGALLMDGVPNDGHSTKKTLLLHIGIGEP